jgi:hypothetical protein
MLDIDIQVSTQIHDDNYDSGYDMRSSSCDFCTLGTSVLLRDIFIGDKVLLKYTGSTRFEVTDEEVRTIKSITQEDKDLYGEVTFEEVVGNFAFTKRQLVLMHADYELRQHSIVPL